MLPIRDIIPTRTPPVVTIGVIALNVLMYSAAGASGAPDTLRQMFAHVSALELAVTLLYLWLFGWSIEDRLGHGRFAAFYLLCGASGAAAQAHWGTAPIFGASGAVAGVIGAYFVLFPTSKLLAAVPFPPLVVEVPAVAYLGIWLLWRLALQVGRTEIWSEIAGYLAGMVLCLILRRPERARVEWWSPS